MKRALDAYSDGEVWKGIVARGMSEDNSWSASAKRYVELYEKAIAKKS